MPLTLFGSLVLSLGFLNGLRALTPVAVLCWGARMGWFSLAHTPFAFLQNPISLVVFSALGTGELIGDKLPKTPPRTQLFPLLARAAFGAGCGAAVAAISGINLLAGSQTESGSSSSSSSHSWTALPLAGAAILGAVGAVLGTFIGYSVRRALTRPGRLPDLPVALAEDAITIGGALFIVSRF